MHIFYNVISLESFGLLLQFFVCQTCLVSPKIIITLVLVSAKYSHTSLTWLVILSAFFLFQYNFRHFLLKHLQTTNVLPPPFPKWLSSKSTWSGLFTQSFSFNLLNAGYFYVYKFLCSDNSVNSVWYFWFFASLFIRQDLAGRSVLKASEESLPQFR